MRIHVGCELSFEFTQTTPMIATLNVHFSRVSDLERPDYLIANPSAPIEGYRDSFGNWCSRLVAPSGRFSLGTDAIIRDSGLSDPIDLNALQHQVQHLPAEVMLFLLGSRYCETDRLSDEAWQIFGNTPLGWRRVQAICDFVHNHIIFGYEHSRATRTALEAYQERRGVCRDYAHLAVAFCRCLNIPARYCTGYITDIGLPPPYPPMDFAAWIEVYLGDRWYAFDPRNNAPRIGSSSLRRAAMPRTCLSPIHLASQPCRGFASGRMKCQNDALFIKDDHEHYVRCGLAEAEDVAHLMAGETAAGALSTHSVLAGPPIGFFIWAAAILPIGNLTVGMTAGNGAKKLPAERAIASIRRWVRRRYQSLHIATRWLVA